MDWYEKYIEEPVRDTVKLLRNNGYNTKSSCGHEMIVMCELSLVDSGIDRLDTLLYDNDYRNYHIDVHLSRHNGSLLASWIKIEFLGKEK